MARGLLPDGTLAEVPGDMFRIVEEIHFRWPNLRVLYLNPERAGVLDAPYKIMEMTQTGPMFVMDVWELDQRVVEKLHMINGANVDVQKELEKFNAVVKAAEDKRKEDELADSSDKLATAIKHFDKGKLTFKYTNDRGQKRVVTERGAKDVTTEVL